jgi:uncharacterized protein YqgC (DUF456 family)
MGGVEWVLYGLGALALVAGVAGVVLPALPGAPLLVAGAVLVAWAGDFHRVGWPALAGLGLLGGVIAAADWAAGVLGAKAFGASRWAVLGATIGLFAGLFLGLPGLLLGPALGAMAFELWKSPDLARATRAGVGAVVGLLVGGVLKIALAFVFLGVLAFALWV